MLKRWAMSLVFGVFFSTAGCLGTLDTKVMEARTAKYDADVVFASLMKKSVEAGDEGWRLKHELQKAAIRNNWASWLMAQGMTVDAEGNPTGGTVAIPLMLASLEQRQKEEEQLVDSKMRLEKAKDALLAAISAYEKSNTTMYATEQEALAAKQEAMAAIDAALHAIGAMAGAAAGVAF